MAVLVGVLAVSTVGATIRDRGPVGDDGDARRLDPRPVVRPVPEGPAVRDEIAGEWGAFDVECRDTWAYGVGVRPDKAAGWRIVSCEKGPDDDVDAVFSDGQQLGRPRGLLQPRPTDGRGARAQHPGWMRAGSSETRCNPCEVDCVLTETTHLTEK